MKQELKQELLRLLDDQDIRDKIIEICSEKNISVNRLTGELQRARRKAEQDIRSLKTDIDDLKKEKDIIQKEKDTIQKEKENFKNELKPYEANIEMYEIYNQLSLKTRTALSSVINTKNPIVFIASCSDSDHLKSVWRYTKELLQNDNSEKDVDILKKLINYMMEIINSVGKVPVYQPIISEIGRRYEDESHCKGPGSRSSGTIQQVLLEGYRQINTGKVICKSVVIV